MVVFLSHKLKPWPTIIRSVRVNQQTLDLPNFLIRPYCRYGVSGMGSWWRGHMLGPLFCLDVSEHSNAWNESLFKKSAQFLTQNIISPQPSLLLLWYIQVVRSETTKPTVEVICIHWNPSVTHGKHLRGPYIPPLSGSLFSYTHSILNGKYFVMFFLQQANIQMCKLTSSMKIYVWCMMINITVMNL